MRPPRTRVARLRQKLRAHNRHVLYVSALSVLLSAVLWGAAYVVSYWLVLLVLSAALGADARMPRDFTAVFIVAAGFLFAVAWMERHLWPHPRPTDKKPGWRITVEFLLTPARLLLSLPDNLRAWQSLSSRELQMAIPFIDRVRAARRFPMHAAPVEIPDDRARERIIFALLHLHILELRHEDETSWLRYVGTPPPPDGIYLSQG